MFIFLPIICICTVPFALCIIAVLYLFPWTFKLMGWFFLYGTGRFCNQVGIFLAMPFPAFHKHFLSCKSEGLATVQLCIVGIVGDLGQDQIQAIQLLVEVVPDKLLDHLLLFFCSTCKWKLFILLASTLISKIPWKNLERGGKG